MGAHHTCTVGNLQAAGNSRIYLQSQARILSTQQMAVQGDFDAVQLGIAQYQQGGRPAWIPLSIQNLQAAICRQHQQGVPGDLAGLLERQLAGATGGMIDEYIQVGPLMDGNIHHFQAHLPECIAGCAQVNGADINFRRAVSGIIQQPQISVSPGQGGASRGQRLGRQP